MLSHEAILGVARQIVGDGIIRGSGADAAVGCGGLPERVIRKPANAKTGVVGSEDQFEPLPLN